MLLWKYIYEYEEERDEEKDDEAKKKKNVTVEITFIQTHISKDSISNVLFYLLHFKCFSSN